MARNLFARLMQALRTTGVMETHPKHRFQEVARATELPTHNLRTTHKPDHECLCECVRLCMGDGDRARATDGVANEEHDARQGRARREQLAEETLGQDAAEFFVAERHDCVLEEPHLDVRRDWMGERGSVSG